MNIIVDYGGTDRRVVCSAAAPQMVSASLGFSLSNVPHHMLYGLKRENDTMGSADTRQEISGVQQVLTAGSNMPGDPSVQNKRLSSVLHMHTQG